MEDKVEEASDSSLCDDEYSVQRVVDHSVRHGQLYYCLKWRGYSSNENTFEHELDAFCPELIDSYWKRINSDMLRTWRVIYACTDANIVWLNRDNLQYYPLSRHIENELFSDKSLWVDCESQAELERQLQEVNSVVSNRVASKGEAPFIIVNDIDLRTPPSPFSFCSTHSTSSLATKTYSFRVTHMAWKIGSLWKTKSSTPGSYDFNDRLIDFDCRAKIFECSSNDCPCGTECHNRVVSLGRQVRLKIVRSNQHKWVLEADQVIEKGTFLGEAFGNIVTKPEVLKTLLSKCPATRYKNILPLPSVDTEEMFYLYRGDTWDVTKFITHSCEPNVIMKYAYQANDILLSKPHVAFFAARMISSGETLTMNFFPGSETVWSPREVSLMKRIAMDALSKNQMAKLPSKIPRNWSSAVLCECNSIKCHRILSVF